MAHRLRRASGVRTPMPWRTRHRSAYPLARAIALLFVLAGLVLPAVAAAKTATTAPQPTVYDRVILEGSKIEVTVTSVPRGNLVYFKIYNRASSPQAFDVYFQRNIRPTTSGLVAPGQIKTLGVQFLNRGVYPYFVVTHDGKKQKPAGKVTVT